MTSFVLDPIVSNGMVLQRDTENTLWGSAPAGSAVTLTMNGSVIEASADESGRFAVVLPPQPASEAPCELVFTCGGEILTVEDVLFGDVFHITGQSNMELPISRTYDPFSDIFRKPDHPLIREFRAPIENCFDPELELTAFDGGHWIRSDSGEAMSMSAAGYFFARTLIDEIKVPIGLVNTSAGGAPIEGRLPCSILREYGDYDKFLDEATAPGYIERTSAEDMARDSAHWRELEEKDKLGSRILAGESPEGEKVSFPYAISDFAGRLWFYRELTVPEGFDTDNAMLLLGTMTDRDVAYVNGTRVGETGYMYPPRFYNIPAGVLKAGVNRIAFLLDIHGGRGGVTVGKRWCVKSGKDILDLTDGWTVCKAVKVEPVKPGTFFQGLPLAMYGRSFAPAYGLKFKAMLIYQGESNCGNADKYEELYTRFVTYYRQRCGYDIPVIATQLPEFGFDGYGGWARLRDAQLRCCRIPGTAMAVTIGVGEWNDLHPLNKWDVGYRLALCTKALVYDKKGYEPVSCVSAECSEGKAKLRFSEPVTLKEGGSGYFEAVFEDGVKPVQAEASEGGIILTLPEGKPTELRYAFFDDPNEPVLFDGKGLPVSPFRFKL